MADEAKPSFDPSQPFAPAQNAKPAFDPNRSFEKTEEPGFAARAFKYVGDQAGKMLEEQHKQVEETKAHPELATKNLKYVGMAAGEALGGPPGAAVGAAGGEAVNQGVRAMSGQPTNLAAIPEAGAEGYVGSKVAGPTLKWAADKIANVGAATVSAVGKIPYLKAAVDASHQAILTYAKRAREVLEMSKDAGEGGVPAAAESLQKQLNQDVTSFHNQVGTQVDDLLAAKSDAKINVADTVKALEDGAKKISASGKLTASEKKAALTQIEQMKETLNQAAGGGDSLTPAVANKLKSDWWKIGYGSEMAPVAPIAKSAGSVLKHQVGEIAPEAKPLLEQQEAVYKIQENLNTSLLKSKKPENFLTKAGNAESRSAYDLGKLDEALGTDMVGSAQNLSAMKSFGKSSLKPGGPPIGNAIVGGVARGAGKLGEALGTPGITSTGAAAITDRMVHGTEGIRQVGGQ